MQYLKRDFCRLSGGNEGVGHRSESDAHTAGRRPGDAGENGDTDRLIDEWIGDGS